MFNIKQLKTEVDLHNIMGGISKEQGERKIIVKQVIKTAYFNASMLQECHQDIILFITQSDAKEKQAVEVRSKK